ncbi:MTMR2 [Symbiodinium sp. CCMP2592]|nr:MTMR2 [Symbiodinium sp. CCMP2592]
MVASTEPATAFLRVRSSRTAQRSVWQLQAASTRGTAPPIGRVVSRLPGRAVDAQTVPAEAVPWLLLLFAVGLPLTFLESARAFPVGFFEFFGTLFGRTSRPRQLVRPKATLTGAARPTSVQEEAPPEDLAKVSWEAPASWQDLLKSIAQLEEQIQMMASPGNFQAKDYVQSVEEVARSAERLESDVRENPAAWNLDLELLRRFSERLRTAPAAPALRETTKLISALISQLTARSPGDSQLLWQELQEEAKSDPSVRSMLKDILDPASEV